MRISDWSSDVCSSDLTKNILADGRVSLLCDGTAGFAEPLTGPRASLQGRAEKTDDPRHRARFLARQPAAEMYAGFGDFGFSRLAVERTHLVAGFGRIHLFADYHPDGDYTRQTLCREKVWQAGETSGG